MKQYLDKVKKVFTWVGVWMEYNSPWSYITLSCLAGFVIMSILITAWGRFFG